MFSVKIPLSKKKTSALKEQFALFDKESLTMGRAWGKGQTADVESSQSRIYPT